MAISSSRGGVASPAAGISSRGTSRPCEASSSKEGRLSMAISSSRGGGSLPCGWDFVERYL